MMMLDSGMSLQWLKSPLIQRGLWQFIRLPFCLNSVFLIACCLGITGTLQAMQDDSASESEVKQEVLESGLNHPFSVTIHPEKNHIYVAESGSQKIIRFVGGKKQDVIVNFPKGKIGQTTNAGEKTYGVGPVSIGFVDKDHLLVGIAGTGAGIDTVNRYKIPDTLEFEPIDASKFIAQGKLEEKSTAVAEGGFVDLVVITDYIFLTCFDGDAEKSWVARASTKNEKISLFRRFQETLPNAKVGGTISVGKSPRGELVVGNMGSANDDHDSKLLFFEPKNGTLLIQFDLPKVKDVIDIAYAADQRKLFVLDHQWNAAGKGGLYQLLAEKDGSGCLANQVLELASPTSMAFDDYGNLYVTVLGASTADNQSTGQLIKITGLSGKNPKK